MLVDCSVPSKPPYLVPLKATLRLSWDGRVQIPRQDNDSSLPRKNDVIDRKRKQATSPNRNGKWGSHQFSCPHYHAQPPWQSGSPILILCTYQWWLFKSITCERLGYYVRLGRKGTVIVLGFFPSPFDIHNNNNQDRQTPKLRTYQQWRSTHLKQPAT